MKKQLLPFGFRKLLMLSAIAAVLTFSSYNAHATNNTTTETKSTIQYVGTTDNGIVFNVKFDNPQASKFDLVIKNETGEIVFQQKYNDKNFDKKIVLLKEAGDARLIFTIKSAATNFSKSFDISTVTRTYEDVVVKAYN